LTDGSMFDPPNAATSPNSRGIWTQSCKRTPSFGASTNRLGSAIRRNKSRKDSGRRRKVCFLESNRQSILFVRYVFNRSKTMRTSILPVTLPRNLPLTTLS
jgi:hypothetical protein